MRLFLHFAIASLVFCKILHAEDEIRVELTTESMLCPLYLGKMHSDNAQYEPAYLKKLKDTLAFDLHHSGYLKVEARDDNLERTLENKDTEIAFSKERWTKAGVNYVLKGIVRENKLDLYAFTVGSANLKEFEGVQLCGNLELDRKQMHKLSDALIKAFFDKEGVANTSILYSIQIEKEEPSSSEWKGEIWECDFDGKGERQITYENSYSITPVFIPSHPSYGKDRFLYVSYKNGQPKIYISSMKKRTGKALLELRGNQLLPAVSRQRDKLAFISDAGGRADLFIHAIDKTGLLEGKPKQLFSYPRSTQASPTFSPSGSHIAFVSDKDGSPRIYTIPVQFEGNKRSIPTLLTKKNRENTCPNWSPDGTKLAYSAKTNGIRQIWLYDFETEEERQLTTGPGNKENPCWAPDSVHLVFNSTDPGSSELYLVNLNQPEAVKISGGPGKKHYPTWGTR